MNMKTLPDHLILVINVMQDDLNRGGLSMHNSPLSHAAHRAFRIQYPQMRTARLIYTGMSGVEIVMASGATWKTDTVSARFVQFVQDWWNGSPDMTPSQFTVTLSRVR